MNHLSGLILLIAVPSSAFAQMSEEEGFFDTYLPIAKLFDSPVFFGVVVGSAVLLLLGAVGFVLYTQRLEKRALAWASSLSPRERVERLSSAIRSEAHLAFVYLRKHAQQPEIEAIVAALEEQRKSGKINPALIYLLEDLQAVPALPILKQIAGGRSRTAELAALAIERITASEEPSAPAKS